MIQVVFGILRYSLYLVSFASFFHFVVFMMITDDSCILLIVTVLIFSSDCKFTVICHYNNFRLIMQKIQIFYYFDTQPKALLFQHSESKDLPVVQHPPSN